MTFEPRVSESFVGLSCTDVVRFDSEAWRFVFEETTTLDVRCPWRIVAHGRIALGYADHAQQFGLTAAVDGISEAKRLLTNIIESVSVQERTADLVIQFDRQLARNPGRSAAFGLEYEMA